MFATDWMAVGLTGAWVVLKLAVAWRPVGRCSGFVGAADHDRLAGRRTGVRCGRGAIPKRCHKAARRIAGRMRWASGRPGLRLCLGCSSVRQGFRQGPLSGGHIKTQTVGPQCLVLPSSRALRYPGLRCARRGRRVEWGYGHRKQFDHLYGGKVVENIVQAVARDILWWQWAQMAEAIARRSGRLVLRVHYELVVGCPAAEAEPVRELMAAGLQRSPDWMHGLPVEGGVKVGRSWGSAK